MTTPGFHEVQFPAGISQGATGGPRFSTSIMTLSSGYEHRNINWSQRRGEWDVSTGLRTQTQIEQLIDFFHARNGRAYGFRFKDWSDYQAPRYHATPGDLFALPLLFTTDGHTTTFQLTKIYSDSGNTYTRVIKKPVAGTLQLYANGLSIPSNQWTVDTTTGIVTITQATVYQSSGWVITGSFQFDTPARFDTDDMKVTITTTDNYSWGPVPIVEIRL